MNQIKLHKKIDLLISKNPLGVKIEEISTLITKNKDSHHYFFYKADKRWIDRLWGNGFLDIIKKKAEDSAIYGYNIPEVNYLVRMAEIVPGKVVDIMLEVPISIKTFNPEVVDRFSWICSTLPVEQLARMVSKIRNERWIPLMDTFNYSGSEFENMFKHLDGARDYKDLLVLAEAVLSVRDKETTESVHRGTYENPFYFKNLSNTKVFEYLANVSNKFAEEALFLVTNVMKKIIAQLNKNNEREGKKVFKIYDRFMLIDVDFFDLKLRQKDPYSEKDDIRELAAVIKVLAERLIGKRCAKTKNVRRIYKQYIDTMPDSQAMWRLRLFVLNLCLNVFKTELKDAFFRLFKAKYYRKMLIGPEYGIALQKGFAVLNKDDKRDYIKRVIEYFNKQVGNKEEQSSLKICGSQILSMIDDQLTKEEKQKVEEAGFEIDPNYRPEPAIGVIRATRVIPRGPITWEKFNKFSVADIAKKLRNDWAPENLIKKKKSDDLWNPLNAEGVGQLLKNDVPKRLQKYVKNAGRFFEREKLDSHYTYYFLLGIQETIKNCCKTDSKIDWDGLIDFYIAIKISGEKKSFEEGKSERYLFNSWLTGWDTIHITMAEIMQELLNEKEGLVLINFRNYRDRILNILNYLISYPDPSPKDEKINTAKFKMKSPDNADYILSDPFTMAINSVRGRAFQALLFFIYQDEKKFKRKDKIKIDDNIKKIYEYVLKKENTSAIMFMFGRYLPTFYFRDRDWIRSLLPKIFPKDQKKKYLYTAAWEGYLVNNLYEEMFFDPKIQQLYERGLYLTEVDYPKQKHFREPDEGIAIHFALAFMYFRKFKFNHPLFVAFRKENNPKQYAYFVDFLGRSFISSDNAKTDELLRKEPESKKRLLYFWEWMIENYSDKDPFIKFGYWINLEKEIFTTVWLAERVKKTLKRTKGSLDWDYGLTKSIVQFAQNAPKDTVEIISLYLLENGVRSGNQRWPLYLDSEWANALDVLYKNRKTRSKTYTLINKLIQEGGSYFWDLKKIVDSDL